MLGGKRRAEVQAAARKDHAGTGRAAREVGQELAPALDALAVVVVSRVRHLVDRIQQQYQPLRAEHLGEGGQLPVLRALPLLRNLIWSPQNGRHEAW